ncbi:DNA-formamidopyrimidine glycosylase [Halalkalibacter sp. APA_J-10(15)]|uniref:DNA-formamidopyrimidine glycosylase n=1 Tax=Halalkalibacter sp. APA_J-10(15) TaxID=2933805 RepID=UPI001FF2712C|nr:DNA-formamidopyrimidine glycosylase [Halalkalibacter sp. APA_J-10(15)]MCK0471352.1 DNA-formamidopyrimidine glycosylase [Halalkalibacter sp. APA_J-10(15)]
MPELPEVETVRRTLKQLVLNKTISHVTVHWGNIIKKPADPERFGQVLIGQSVRDIHRRGKFLIFQLDELSLVSHLRMEGRYGLFEQHDQLQPHTHVLFTFTDGTELRYQDVRKFGTMHIFQKGKEEEELPLSQLGVEPFSKEFTIELMQTVFERTNRAVKAVLLDQKFVVGLGNIYVDEALFRAKLLPTRLASSIQGQELQLLHKAIVETLKEAVELGGSSIKSYVNGQGEMGMFQQQLAVYGRKDEPCVSCGTVISKKVVAGRGTHYCVNCQK